MKNLTWLLGVFFLFVSNLGFSNIVTGSDNSGGGYLAQSPNDDINFYIPFVLNRLTDQDISTPNGPIIAAGQFSPLGLGTDEPLFLVIEDLSHDEILAAIPLLSLTYHQTDNNGCPTWTSEASGSFSNYYLCHERNGKERRIYGDVFYSIQVHILAGNSAVNPSSFFMPTTNANKNLLGISDDNQTHNFCVEHNRVNFMGIVECYTQTSGTPSFPYISNNSNSDENSNESRLISQDTESTPYIKPNPFRDQINAKSNKITIHTEEWESGIYILLLKTNIGTESYKIIKI